MASNPPHQRRDHLRMARRPPRRFRVLEGDPLASPALKQALMF